MNIIFSNICSTCFCGGWRWRLIRWYWAMITVRILHSMWPIVVLKITFWITFRWKLILCKFNHICSLFICTSDGHIWSLIRHIPSGRARTLIQWKRPFLHHRSLNIISYHDLLSYSPFFPLLMLCHFCLL